MPRRHEGDGWDEELPRLGRFSEADAQLWEQVALWPRRTPRRAVQQTRRRILRWDEKIVSEGFRYRVDHLLGRRSTTNGREVVVKVASTTKNAQAARRTFAYVARTRRSDVRRNLEELPQVLDENGNAVNAESAIGRIDAWDDEPGGNSSDAIASLDTNVVAWHLVWSIQEADRGAIERFVAATRATVDEIFASHGFSVLWCLHRDTPDHPHVHLLVKAVSRSGDRIRCDKDGDFLFGMRTVLARNLRTAGLDYIASRREDRSHLRPAILRGREQLRQNASQAARFVPDAKLSRVAPRWWSRYGQRCFQQMQARGEVGTGLTASDSRDRSETLSVTQTRRQRARNLRRRRRGSLKYGAGYRQVFHALTRMYRDPGFAIESITSFLSSGARRRADGRLAVPNFRLCRWLLLNAPGAYGDLLHVKPDTGDVHKVVRALSKLPIVSTSRSTAEIAGDAGADGSGSGALVARIRVRRSLSRVFQWAQRETYLPETIDDIAHVVSLRNELDLVPRITHSKRSAKSSLARPSPLVSPNRARPKDESVAEQSAHRVSGPTSPQHVRRRRQRRSVER